MPSRIRSRPVVGSSRKITFGPATMPAAWSRPSGTAPPGRTRREPGDHPRIRLHGMHRTRAQQDPRKPEMPKVCSAVYPERIRHFLDISVT